jgi:hypothetical protein
MELFILCSFQGKRQTNSCEDKKNPALATNAFFDN